MEHLGIAHNQGKQAVESIINHEIKERRYVFVFVNGTVIESLMDTMPYGARRKI